MDLVPQPNSKFLKVKCTDCESEMIIFNHAKTVIECKNEDCSAIIATPASGKAIIEAEIIEDLE